MAARKTKKNADQKPLEHEAPKPIQVDQPATVIPAEGKAASPEHKNKTATKTHWVPEGKDRTLGQKLRLKSLLSPKNQIVCNKGRQKPQGLQHYRPLMLA